MKTLCLLLALPTLAASPGPAEKKDIAEDKTLLAAQPVDWIKTYSLAPYSVSWNVTVTVKNIQDDLPKVQKTMEKAGATLANAAAQSAASSMDKSQQLSWRVPEKGAKEALKRLRKLGSVPEPKITHIGEAISVSEVSDKLEKLTVERNMHREELSKTPSIALMVDEMISHLSMVKQVREGLGSNIIVNMTVREKR